MSNAAEQKAVVDCTKVIHKAQKQAQEKYISGIYTKAYKVIEQERGYLEAVKSSFFMENPFVPDSLIDAIGVIGLDDERRTWGKLSGTDTVALFVTVSPEPGSIQEFTFLSLVHKFCRKSRKGIRGALYCFEQSGYEGGPELGYHPHAHILLFLDKTQEAGERARVRKQVYGAFSKLKTKSEAYLQVKAVSKKSVQSKVDYILGNKHKDDAPAKHKYDLAWRQKIQLQDVYLTPDGFEY